MGRCNSGFAKIQVKFVQENGTEDKDRSTKSYAIICYDYDNACRRQEHMDSIIKKEHQIMSDAEQRSDVQSFRGISFATPFIQVRDPQDSNGVDQRI